MHNCEYVTDWHDEPGDDGDPIYCDRLASIKFNGIWLCAEHYDDVVEYEDDENA